MRVMPSLYAVAASVALLSTGQIALAQESDEPEAQEVAAEEPADEEASADDDVFMPSETIEADSEISFPADI